MTTLGSIEQGYPKMKRLLALFHAVLAATLTMAGTPVDAFDDAARPRFEQAAANGSDIDPVDKLIALQSNWTKSCGEDKETHQPFCYTALVFGPSPGNLTIAFVVYDVKGSDKQILRFLVRNQEPFGLNIKHGVKISTERGDAADAAFVICLNDGCYAEANVQREFIDSIAKSSFIRISFWKKNRASEYIPGNILVNFEMPMTGFGKAFNGPPTDPKKLQSLHEQEQRQNAGKNEDRSDQP